MKRAIVIVIDGVGIGAMPDAQIYGDAGSNTIGNLAKHFNGLELPHLELLGLGKIYPVLGIQSAVEATGSFGKLAEKSPGKDSTTGHWELAGYELERAFPTYPDGFPEHIIKSFETETGFKVIGNKTASGTEIIKELGEAHLNGDGLIVYTSADSVFQIAAHEKVVPIEKQYEICCVARRILSGPHAVARVIARPFLGENAQNFYRTRKRKDFSLVPEGDTLHLLLQNAGIPTIAIGKIHDLYAGKGIDRSIKTTSNREGMDTMIEVMKSCESGLIMMNLVDFDMLWGHRNDPDGFYQGLQEFDGWLPVLFDNIDRDDLVIITSDHGNDPTMSSTDHSREYVPVLVFGPKFKRDVNIGMRDSFADVQATLADYFCIQSTGSGTSFLSLIN